MLSHPPFLETTWFFSPLVLRIIFKNSACVAEPVLFWPAPSQLWLRLLAQHFCHWPQKLYLRFNNELKLGKSSSDSANCPKQWATTSFTLLPSSSYLGLDRHLCYCCSCSTSVPPSRGWWWWWWRHCSALLSSQLHWLFHQWAQLFPPRGWQLEHYNQT